MVNKIGLQGASAGARRVRKKVFPVFRVARDAVSFASTACYATRGTALCSY